MSNLTSEPAEPSAAELAAIDVEWPLIQADIDMLANPDAIDALVDQLSIAELAVMTDLDRRRLRRAETRLLRSVELAHTVTTQVAPSARQAAA